MSKAKAILNDHESRCLDNEGDRNAVARAIALKTKLTESEARTILAKHGSRCLDDEGERDAVARDLGKRI